VPALEAALEVVFVERHRNPVLDDIALKTGIIIDAGGAEGDYRTGAAPSLY
jgi:hypothetical protein